MTRDEAIQTTVFLFDELARTGAQYLAQAAQHIMHNYNLSPDDLYDENEMEEEDANN